MRINLRVISVAVSIAASMIGAVLLADPGDLGLTSTTARWLGIVAVGLGVLQGFLPRVQGVTTDPFQLANRIWGLPPEDRKKIGEILARRAEREQRTQADDEPAFLRRTGKI